MPRKALFRGLAECTVLLRMCTRGGVGKEGGNENRYSLRKEPKQGWGLASQLPQGPFIDIHLLGEIATYFDLRVMRKAA